MKVTHFDPSSDLIFVVGHVWGHGTRSRKLRLVVDTGASETVIIPEILDDLGYSPRHGEAITSLRSAVAEEHGYLIRVARFAALGPEDPCLRGLDPGTRFE